MVAAPERVMLSKPGSCAFARRPIVIRPQWIAFNSFRRRWNQSVPGHHSDKLRAVGRLTRIDYGADVAEILGADVGRKYDQGTSRGTVWIAELMDRSASGMHPLSLGQIPDYAIN